MPLFVPTTGGQPRGPNAYAESPPRPAARMNTWSAGMWPAAGAGLRSGAGASPVVPNTAPSPTRTGAPEACSRAEVAVVVCGRSGRGGITFLRELQRTRANGWKRLRQCPGRTGSEMNGAAGAGCCCGLAEVCACRLWTRRTAEMRRMQTSGFPPSSFFMCLTACPLDFQEGTIGAKCDGRKAIRPQ